jgi:hypothetical protein
VSFSFSEREKQRRHFSVKTLLTGLLLGLYCLGAATASQAGPVTFRFEAEVASVGMGLPSGGAISPLPFLVQPGDSIAVRFSFTPSSGAGSYPQLSPVNISILDHELTVSAFQITVLNNDLGVLDVPGRIADPWAAGNVDRQAFLADRISLSCLGGGEPYCGSFESAPELRFIPTIAFEDEDLGLLQSEDLLADPAIWNSFSGRELSLQFNNHVYIGAYIGSVQVIPEATTISCLVMSMLVLSLHRIHRLTKRTGIILGPPSVVRDYACPFLFRSR